MRLTAVIVGVLAIAFGVGRQLFRRQRSRAIDAGSVSEGWLAEQRGIGNDRFAS